MKSRRSLREHLLSGHPLVGLLQSHPNTVVTEIAAICGFQFLMLDGEHGVYGDQDYLHAVQTLAAFDVFALVRLATQDLHALGRYMDMGVDAIVVPNVSTAEQARALVRAMDYPPAGTRGVGAALHRSTRYGADFASYLKAPRANVCLLPIIESALGSANADEILAVDGVDGVVIGPADLSADLGRAGDFSQPAFMEAVTHIERAAAARGKLLGGAPHAGNPIDALLTRGYRLLIVASDINLMREAFSAQVAKSKTSLPGT